MQVVHRRQQFYGEWYYHTTQALSAAQPASTERSVAKALGQKVAESNGAAQGRPASDADMKGRDGAGGCAAVPLPLDPLLWLLERLNAAEERAGRAVFRSDGSNSPNQCLVNEYVGNQV
jgi:hypothetical protein